MIDEAVTELTPGGLLRRAQQVHTGAWSRTVSDSVTGPQYAVLVAVAGWDDVDQRLAGELASHDKSTTTDIVRRLVRDGWLVITRDERDGRRKVLRLTPPATRRLARVTVEAADVQDQLVEPLPAVDRDRFVDALARVAIPTDHVIRAQRPAAPGGSALVMMRTPGYLLRRAQQLHATLWASAVPQLTEPQYAVLAAVAGVKTLDQAAIGARASLDSSTVADVVRRLEARDWLRRSADERDGRRWQVAAHSERHPSARSGAYRGVSRRGRVAVSAAGHTRTASPWLGSQSWRAYPADCARR